MPTTAGLDASAEMARFLWDKGFAAVAADNPTVEVRPGDPTVGSLHRRLIPALGLPLGESCGTSRSWPRRVPQTSATSAASSRCRSGCRMASPRRRTPWRSALASRCRGKRHRRGCHPGSLHRRSGTCRCLMRQQRDRGAGSWLASPLLHVLGCGREALAADLRCIPCAKFYACSIARRVMLILGRYEFTMLANCWLGPVRLSTDRHAALIAGMLALSSRCLCDLERGGIPWWNHPMSG
jgi:hypothetical protein